MKLIIKSWLLDKKATKMLLWWFGLSCVYIVINSWYPILISDVFNHNSDLISYLVFIGIISIVQIILSSIIEILYHNSSAKAYGTINTYFSDILLDADYDLFTKYSTSTIGSMRESIHNISQMGRTVGDVILQVISLIATLFAMYRVAGSFVLYVAIIYSIGMIVLKYTLDIDIKIDREFDDAKHVRNQEVENVIYGFSEVRSFNMTNFYKKKIHDMNIDMYKLYKKKDWYHAASAALINIIDTIGMFAVIIYTFYAIQNGILNAANGMSLIMYVFRLIGPILFMLNTISDLSRTIASCKVYEEIVNYKNTHINGSIVLSGFNDCMRIEDVSFAYNDTDSVLNHINMEFKKGSHIGICGASGGGKSSLLKLLNKFYTPKNGRITIDGIDINDITDESYRDIIGYVNQENIIFPGTLYENVIYGTPQASNWDVDRACEKACLTELIKSLPNGLNTVVGPRGLKLSGGQKQRIALARIFLKDPQIILLDEATASLDNESEYEIQNVINNIHDKTVITIAHRLSTIRKCDCIYVMKDKTVIESGTHEDLMKNEDGVYRSMVSYANDTI